MKTISFDVPAESCLRVNLEKNVLGQWFKTKEDAEIARDMFRMVGCFTTIQDDESDDEYHYKLMVTKNWIKAAEWNK